jgi:hypothetical protein
MKKVIANLKEKNKGLNDKINELQKELIEVKFDKEIMEKELMFIKNSPGYKNIGSNGFGGGKIQHNQQDVNGVDNLSSPRTPIKN